MAHTIIQTRVSGLSIDWELQMEAIEGEKLRYSRLGHAQSRRLELLHIGVTIGPWLVFPELTSQQELG
jgi:hypothetical protein